MERNHPSEKERKSSWRHLLNIHVLFVLLVVVIILLIIFRFSKWGNRVDTENFFQHNPLIQEAAETFDLIVPKTDENGNTIANQSPHSILFFGNSVFADDRGSENNVVNMIAERTGATVYNCSIGGSYMAAGYDDMTKDPSGLDVYSFYFLSLYLAQPETVRSFDWLESSPNANILPETQEVRHIMDTVDMDTVDTIAILYDASDYLAGHKLHFSEDPTNITSFIGALEGGLEVLQKAYPHIRIIIMSPTYAFGVDENGEYVSSDTAVYNEDQKPLSTYMLQECSTCVSQDITFIDNIYGTFNEDEAPDYLLDNLHLNQKGREKVVDRFIHALTYYDGRF